MTGTGLPGRRPPGVMVVLAVFGLALFVIPMVGLVVRTPWGRLGSLFTSAVVLDALRVSLISSLAAAVASALLGIPLAWVLARLDFPGHGIVRTMALLPMVLPPVVGGAALLFAFGRRGVLGGALESIGLTLPFSIWGVILSNTFVAMPFMVVTVEGALRGLDGRHEAAAATLGASELTILRRVTLPMIAPALRSGIVLSWARALGEFGATVTFAGNFPGRTQTLPLAVSVALDADRDAALAISLLLVALSFVLLFTLRDRWWGSR